MTLHTPHDEAEESQHHCRLGRYLWLIPIATAVLSWGITESLEDHLTCGDTIPEVAATAIGALIGVFISNALKEHYCATKDHRD